jgi:ADP-ribosylglycohydrolase
MKVKVDWIDPVELVGHELTQLEEEGLDVADFRRRWQERMQEKVSPGALREAASGLLDQLAAFARSFAECDVEPSSLERILQLSDPPSLLTDDRTPALSALSSRIAGGWFGRAAGCLLGKPVEGLSRQAIREILMSNGTWPLSDYITREGVPEELLRTYSWDRHPGEESFRENIVCMTEDDDMNYPMVNLSVLEATGRAFTSEQIGEAWLRMLPILSTFTAERIAYVNCVSGLVPPETATHHNPYREWIGAQIRGDIFGWVSPGNPRGAVELAFKDARLSHTRNGIYGELFAAAMVAAACAAKHPREAVEIGLLCVPRNSRIAEAIRFAISLYESEPSWEGAVDKLHERFSRYNWVHTVNNAALVVAAILYADGDFERSICNAVMGGWDTDCNGATVGSVAGTVLGIENLPKRWIAPLNNRIRSSLKGFDNSRIDDLVQRTLTVACAKG